MNTFIKALFGLAVFNVLIYAFYSVALILILTNFWFIGVIAVLIGILAFFNARKFYRLLNYKGNTKTFDESMTRSIVLLVLISILTVFLMPALQETITDIGQEFRLKKYKAGKAPIENGIWKYREKGLIMPANGLSVSCKNGLIDGKVVYNYFNIGKVDFYSKGELDSVTFWLDDYESSTYFLKETWVGTDTFRYLLNENLGEDVLKIGINENRDTILKVKSPVVSSTFDIYKHN